MAVPQFASSNDGEANGLEWFNKCCHCRELGIITLWSGINVTTTWNEHSDHVTEVCRLNVKHTAIKYEQIIGSYANEH